MRLYVAGPMSGMPELNFPAFHAESARLRALGFEVTNPAEINADPASGWLACMRADIPELVLCDGVALLPGWQKSRGASIEERLARDLGLLVFEASTLIGLAGDLPVLSAAVLTPRVLEPEDKCA